MSHERESMSIEGEAAPTGRDCVVPEGRSVSPGRESFHAIISCGTVQKVPRQLCGVAGTIEVRDVLKIPVGSIKVCWARYVVDDSTARHIMFLNDSTAGTHVGTPRAPWGPSNRCEITASNTW